jgi:glutathione S-transferase
MNGSTLAGEVTLYGFHRSTYVNVARLVLHAKGVAFAFHDTEREMYTAEHLQRHPFGRVPVLQHGDFRLYETSAIVRYVDDAFDGPRLTPTDLRQRARMNQWIGSVDSYFYPYMIYHLVHERVVFAELGIEADAAVVAQALPKCERALNVMEEELRGGFAYIVDENPTLADYFLLPTLTALGFAPEGKQLLGRFPKIRAWLARMGTLPNVVQFRSTLPPPAPIEHARRWVHDHRPRAVLLPFSSRPGRA